MIDELKQMIAGYSRPSQSSQSGSLDLASEIAKLSDLHRQGVLSDAEFAQAKSKLLGWDGKLIFFRIRQSETAIVRVQGDAYRTDIELAPRERASMLVVVQAYEWL